MYFFPVATCSSEERGDGFSASRALAPLEVVLRVAPIVAVPKDAYISLVCASCFQCSSLEVESSERCKKHDARHVNELDDERTTGAQMLLSKSVHQSLQQCEGCNAVSFCQRCLQSRWVQDKHAEECQALRELMCMRPAVNHDDSMNSASANGLNLQSLKTVKDSSSPSRGSKSSKARKIQHDNVEAVIAGDQSGGKDANASLEMLQNIEDQNLVTSRPPSNADDTTTLRLMLSLVFLQARVRAHYHDGSTARGTGNKLVDPTVTKPYAPEEQLGPSEVIQDGLQDVRELHGDYQQDLSEDVVQRFVSAAHLLKGILPAWCRCSIEQYITLFTKLWFNQHDIISTRKDSLIPGRSAVPRLKRQSQQTRHDQQASCRTASSKGPELKAVRNGNSNGSKLLGTPSMRLASSIAMKKDSSLQAGQDVRSDIDSTSSAKLLSSQSHNTKEGEGRNVIHTIGEGLFPSVARLNHSCRPNCRLKYDEWGCLVVYVREGIHVAKGEELFASYIDPVIPRETRRQHLFDRYGFWCKCSACMEGL
ncbi:hypothetical protein CEUSTIGMA_g3810.t1 [Chlamydomonas eustigma]|uniref:SET domain-containing protein n=1 Tax=Chlamydomonas eustigma TaxID=1157962 RepID=A0A250WZU1_9CHLO|nr:hypothetical protein CEUSTIGMA_g3810.t1 [Chlamydomonas eustigma]|eukprot:GAX76364.1 hypothetical protein CEUSTIGMA_g3810.t1 [Chlamydomonas eustigma]